MKEGGVTYLKVMFGIGNWKWAAEPFHFLFLTLPVTRWYIVFCWPKLSLKWFLQSLEGEYKKLGEVIYLFILIIKRNILSHLSDFYSYLSIHSRNSGGGGSDGSLINWTVEWDIQIDRHCAGHLEKKQHMLILGVLGKPGQKVGFSRSTFYPCGPLKQLQPWG